MAMLGHVLYALKLLVIVDAAFSWFAAPDAFPRTLTKPILDPVYEPIRHLLQPLTGSLDLTPLVALIALHALQWALVRKPGSDA